MDIIKEGRELHRFEVEKLLSDKVAAKEVLDLLYGSYYEEDPYLEYKVIRRRFDKPEGKWWQRANLFWFAPLYWLTVPFQYIVRGTAKWDEDTWVSKLAVKLVGDNA